MARITNTQFANMAIHELCMLMKAYGISSELVPEVRLATSLENGVHATNYLRGDEGDWPSSTDFEMESDIFRQRFIVPEIAKLAESIKACAAGTKIQCFRLPLPGVLDFEERGEHDGFSLRILRAYDVSADVFPIRFDVLFQDA
jgi:hypothetical protein